MGRGHRRSGQRGKAFATVLAAVADRLLQHVDTGCRKIHLWPPRREPGELVVRIGRGYRHDAVERAGVLDLATVVARGCDHDHALGTGVADRLEHDAAGA